MILRVGNIITYRKPGQPARRALIEWIYDNDTIRVRPDTGRRTIITPLDVKRAEGQTRE